ncbi:hypothetical protein, partial [Streptomyces clavuligerus]
RSLTPAHEAAPGGRRRCPGNHAGPQGHETQWSGGTGRRSAAAHRETWGLWGVSRAMETDGSHGEGRARRGAPPPLRPSLWVEEPTGLRRLPDPVRTAAVRAVLIVSLTMIQAMVAFFCTLAGSWLAFPMVLSSVASTVAATWSVLDVWVTRQAWRQRHGVVSEPSSSARQLRRERRRERREVRRRARRDARIRPRRRLPGARGQSGHPGPGQRISELSEA